ncbi:unnamed protein product [Umbelopsis vinacea]
MEAFTGQIAEIFSTLPEGNLQMASLYFGLGHFQQYPELFHRQAHQTVTPLSGRLFATWTWSVSMIRIYAAFHLNNKIMYNLGIWSYVIALTHYVGELVVFGGCKINVPFMSPMIVAEGFADEYSNTVYQTHVINGISKTEPTTYVNFERYSADSHAAN